MLVLRFCSTFAQTDENPSNFRPSRQNCTNTFARLAKGNEDPNTFEEFLEPKEYIDHRHLFTTCRIFNSKDELVDWAEQTAKSRISDRPPYVILAYERGGAVRKMTKPIVDDEEEEVPIKRPGPYEIKNQMSTSENWQLFVHNGRHNHKIAVYNHGHAQAARLTEEQLQ
ncbi:hypothetical protein M9H77_27904 [Catharanthus roseus]|uniref:Uncharacterized protein n=1 Tax=Catharanthus roseus TaxID=4058 RepID=A0ACC0AEG3_CATRO|nr:hypothetical protein M9H77_27904 [Catharanthus roseus]